MKVYIKNKLVSLRGSSTVVDESGNSVYFVKGKVFSITRKKFICDLNGKKMFTVRNKYFRLFNHTAYVYDKDNEKIARVKHGFFAVKKFTISGYGDDIEINGDIFSPRSEIYKNGKSIGVITRQFTIVQDAFCLEADEKDIPFLIALVIAIDLIQDRKYR